MPSTLYPPTASSLAGCYLLDVAMGLVAACDERGDGFTVNKEGSMEQFGPRKQMLERSMVEYEERKQARILALVSIDTEWLSLPVMHCLLSATPFVGE